MTNNRHPMVITSKSSRAHIVRQLALDHGLKYEEVCVVGRNDLVRFVFPPMDDGQSYKFAAAIPKDVFAWNAVIVNQSDSDGV